MTCETVRNNDSKQKKEIRMVCRISSFSRFATQRASRTVLRLVWFDKEMTPTTYYSSLRAESRTAVCSWRCPYSCSSERQLPAHFVVELLLLRR